MRSKLFCAPVSPVLLPFVQMFEPSLYVNLCLLSRVPSSYSLSLLIRYVSFIVILCSPLRSVQSLISSILLLRAIALIIYTIALSMSCLLPLCPDLVRPGHPPIRMVPVFRSHPPSLISSILLLLPSALLIYTTTLSISCLFPFPSNFSRLNS